MKKTITWINRLFFLIVLSLTFYFFTEHWGEFHRILERANLFNLTLVFFIFSIFLTLQGLLSALILKHLHPNISVWEVLPIILYTLLGKYIPGKVWIVVMRTSSFARHSIPVASVLASSTLEHIFALSTGVLIYTLSLGNNFPQFSLFTIILMGLFTSIITLFPDIFLKFLNRFLFFLGRTPVKGSISRSMAIFLFSSYTATWFIVGAGVYLLAGTLSTTFPGGKMFYVTGMFAFSVISGFLAFFSPGGIGVREGILIIAFKPFIPIVEATLIVVAARIIYSISEVFVILLTTLLCNRFKKSIVVEHT